MVFAEAFWQHIEPFQVCCADLGVHGGVLCKRVLSKTRQEAERNWPGGWAVARCKAFKVNLRHRFFLIFFYKVILGCQGIL